MQFAEVGAGFNDGLVVAVAASPGRSWNADQIGIGRPIVHPVEQGLVTTEQVLVHGHRQGVEPVVHGGDAVGFKEVVEGGGAALVEANQKDARFARWMLVNEGLGAHG